jgi:hypothetical protein
MDKPQELAEAETYLLRVLESSTRLRGPQEYNVTAAAQECRQAAGNWDVQSLGLAALEDILARHPAAD